MLDFDDDFLFEGSIMGDWVGNLAVGDIVGDVVTNTLLMVEVSTVAPVVEVTDEVKSDEVNVVETEDVNASSLSDVVAANDTVTSNSLVQMYDVSRRLRRDVV
mmetsp:Transcript_43798/g.56162  ORF Transcript_43798/g.56162 Transcript_43798/m.56162 type:complete len:103 (-) Transcript_43798:476-784(-)